jgi:xylulokinase
VLGALDVDPSWLPRTFEGPEVTGAVSATAGEATGLRPGTPIVAGGGDQAAAAVGVGAVRPGVVSVSLGTSGVVFATTDGPLVEPEGRLHAFCHSVPDRWHVMGVMLSAAGSLRWYRDAVAPGTEFGDLLDEAVSIPAGSDGILFLPYLTGERTPHPDPLARGAFVGLTVRHGRAHLTRAVLEGVAFGLRDSLDLMRSAGIDGFTEARATGGGSRSRLWRQILADVLDVPVATTSSAEGAAEGAALLAAVGVGWFGSVQEACDGFVRVTGTTPTSADVAAYAGAHERYASLYPALVDLFHATP